MPAFSNVALTPRNPHRPNQRHVIDFAAGVDFLIVIDFEQGDSLIAAFQETLPAFFMVDLHAEKLDVEFSCARQILDVIDDMVEAGDFKWCIHIDLPQVDCMMVHYFKKIF